MQSLQKNPLFEFHPNTLESVRKTYELEDPERIEEAIDLLEDWIRKQNHLIKKDFSRDYLERAIIIAKGSIERAKKRIDKLCTLKTLMPRFFDKYDAKKDFSYLGDMVTHAIIPKMTKDNNRIYVSKFRRDGFDSESYLDSYKFGAMMCEYSCAHDYNNGYIAVVDYRDTNMFEFVSALNLVEMRQIEGYAMRIKGINLLTSSNAIDTMAKILKQMFSAKIGNRIHVHKTLESLHECVPKDCLPEECGGDLKSIRSLQDDWLNVLSTENNIEYFKMMSKACTDESCRRVDKFNEEYSGMPGSFRKLTVD